MTVESTDAGAPPISPVPPGDKLGSARARRIVAAMRTTVAHRGITGATFDQVAREAGVSRGLLHYHFGTKEHLLVEVVRHDIAERSPEIEAAVRAARSADDLVALFVAQLEHLDPERVETFTLVLELFTASRRNEDMRQAMAELFAELRERVGAVLAEKADEGAVTLRHSPAAVGTVLAALGDGLVLRMLTEPERDHSAEINATAEAARCLLEGAR